MSNVKVIVPLDGSKLAESALPYLQFLANLGNINVRLLSVAEDASLIGLPAAQELSDTQERLLSAYLPTQVQRLQAQDVLVETRLQRGNPAEAILEEARDWPADFILISTHGRTGYQRWHLGSVADKVIRGASCNTLAIGPKPAVESAAGASLASVLVPLDGSQLAEQALPLAQRLVAGTGAKLHFVRVSATPIFVDEDTAGYAWKASEDAAMAYLEEKRKQLVALEPEAAMLVGPPADAILRYAEEQHISLIVSTSHGRGGLNRLALGSVTDRLLGGPAPVLVVRPVDQAQAAL